MAEFKKFKIGSSKTIQKVVKESDTALSYGSGKLEKLFATPSLVALMLEACYELVDADLPEGFISVSKSAKVDHIAPTTLGETVTVKVTVIDASKVFIKFKMEAFDEVGIIGYGEHVRAVVQKDGLLERASKRERSLESINY
jgi:predicted thioesterase